MDKSKWEYKKLGEVCQYSTRRFDVNKLSKDNYVGVDNLLKNYCGKVPASSLDKIMSAVAYNPHDVLIGNIRPYLKKIWLADSIGGASGDVLVLQIKNTYKGSIYPRFLYYTLANDYFFNYNYQHSKGVKMPRGDKKEILKYAIQLPTIDIQKNIAFTLDQLSAIISLKQQQMKEYDALAQSLFYEMFGDMDGSEKSFEKKIFGECFKLKSGDSLTAKNIVKGPYAVFGGNGIVGYHSEYNAEGQQIIIGRVGALCGNVHLIDGKNFITDNAFILSDSIGFDKVYLLYFLSMLNLRDYAREAMQPVISNKTLKGITIPLTPLSLQRSFAEKVKAIEHQKSLLKQSIAETQTLLDSRMQEYFG